MNTTFQKMIKTLKNPYVITFLIFFVFSIIIVLLQRATYDNDIIYRVFMVFEIPAIAYFFVIGFAIERMFQDAAVVHLTQEALSVTVFSSLVWSLPVWGIIHAIKSKNK